MSHEYIVAIANQGRSIRDTWTVTYKSKTKQGTLAPGQIVGIEHEMVFNVALTGRT